MMTRRALAAVQRAAKIPKDNSPPWLGGHQGADVVLDQMEGLPWQHGGQQGQDLLHEVGKRQIAQQRREKEHKRKEGEEKRVRQLRGLPEGVIGPRLGEDALHQGCHRHTTEKTVLVGSAVAGSHGPSPTFLLLSGNSYCRPSCLRRGARSVRSAGSRAHHPRPANAHARGVLRRRCRKRALQTPSQAMCTSALPWVQSVVSPP